MENNINLFKTSQIGRHRKTGEKKQTIKQVKMIVIFTNICFHNVK